jgi:hypothetical protein
MTQTLLFISQGKEVFANQGRKGEKKRQRVGGIFKDCCNLRLVVWCVKEKDQ